MPKLPLLTRSVAVRAMGFLWLCYAVGFWRIEALQYNHAGADHFSPLLEVVDDARPILWGITGAIALAGASRPRFRRIAIALMGALVSERIVALVIWGSPLNLFSVATWAGVYLAVLLANRIPEAVPHDPH